MRTKLYTVLGYLTWEGVKLVVSRKLRQNRVKMGAAATVAAVLVAGLAIVRSQSQADS